MRTKLTIGIAFVAVAAIGGITAVAGAAQTDAPTVSATVYQSTRDVAGKELASSLDVPQLQWDATAPRTDEPKLTVSAADDPALASCGSDELPGSMLVLSQDGTAYCIRGIDTDSPTAMFQARSVAQRIIEDRVPSQAELDILQLRVELSMLEPNSDEANAVRGQIDAKWKALSPAQREALKG